MCVVFVIVVVVIVVVFVVVAVLRCRLPQYSKLRNQFRVDEYCRHILHSSFTYTIHLYLFVSVLFFVSNLSLSPLLFPLCHLCRSVSHYVLFFCIFAIRHNQIRNMCRHIWGHPMMKIECVCFEYSYLSFSAWEKRQNPNPSKRSHIMSFQLLEVLMMEFCRKIRFILSDARISWFRHDLYDHMEDTKKMTEINAKPISLLFTIGHTQSEAPRKKNCSILSGFIYSGTNNNSDEEQNGSDATLLHSCILKHFEIFTISINKLGIIVCRKYKSVFSDK